ncbi:hypothetical protein [Micromonospora sp. NPDC006431]|uniref:hypothetical protein n=1 Tax=Micromonospora sp. NPDC006431 TaxID=3364235 RepID=UPI0036B433F0
MTRAPVEGTIRSADGTTIAYERSGSGPTVVMVDAAGGFREMGPMRPLAARLADGSPWSAMTRGAGAAAPTPRPTT